MTTLGRLNLQLQNFFLTLFCSPVALYRTFMHKSFHYGACHLVNSQLNKQQEICNRSKLSFYPKL